MKLSSRKQLLSEAEQELKLINQLLSEGKVVQSDVEKVKKWLEGAIPMVSNEKNFNFHYKKAADLLNYFKIATAATPKDARVIKNTTTNAISTSSIIITDFKKKLDKMKKLEASLPEIEKIYQSFEAEVAKMK